MEISEDKIITKSFYDKNARNWVIKRSNLEACRAEFEQYRELLPNGKILDLGCGTGRDASLFLAENYDYTGIDLSDGMIDEAKKLFPAGKFEAMDLCDLKFNDQSFDGIWSFAAYLHIPKKDISDAIKEANRVLKLGGIGYITIKKGNFESYLGEGGSKRYWAFYGKNQFAKILQDNGFEIIKSWEDKRDYNPPTDVSIFLSYFIKKIV
ncbi:MAG: methyltransferase domain-containing protein [Candidatus Saccharibacteria bacterium]